MPRELHLHPSFRCNAVSRINVEPMRRGPGTLFLYYYVAGATGDLLLPDVAKPERADNLWQHTCFEAFLRRSPPLQALPPPRASAAGGGSPLGGETEGDSPYLEFNFSPSQAWAA